LISELDASLPSPAPHDEPDTFAAPVVIFGSTLYGGWLVAYVWAYAFGIVFQYFTIKPMRVAGSSTGEI
jgi:hypothetical protein